MRNIKKQILRIIGAIFMIALFYGGTHFLTAQEGQLPVTPPATPPTTPPSTLTPTPTEIPDDDDDEDDDEEEDEGKGRKATGGVSGKQGEVDFKLQFNAHGGNSPKGHINYSDSTGKRVKGTVNECYTQDGKAAAFAGTVEGEGGDTQYFLVKVEDNGEGRNADPDKLGIWFTESKPSCVVGAFPAFAANGNLQVH